MIIAYCVICLVIWLVGFWLEADDIACSYNEAGLKLFFLGLFWPLILAVLIIVILPLAVLDESICWLAKKVVKFKEGRKL